MKYEWTPSQFSIATSHLIERVFPSSTPPTTTSLNTGRSKAFLPYPASRIVFLKVLRYPPGKLDECFILLVDGRMCCHTSWLNAFLRHGGIIFQRKFIHSYLKLRLLLFSGWKNEKLFTVVWKIECVYESQFICSVFYLMGFLQKNLRNYGNINNWYVAQLSRKNFEHRNFKTLPFDVKK